MTTIQQFFGSLPNLRNGDANGFQVLHVSTGLDPAYHMLPHSNATIGYGAHLKRAARVEGAMYASAIAGLEGIDDAKARALGLTLAILRMGMHQTWNLVAGDMEGAQVKAIEYYNDRYVATTHVIDDTNINAVLPHEATRNQFRAIGDENMLADDSLIAKLLRLGSVLPVLCGIVLVKTDTAHHFVGNEKAAFRGVYNQLFGRDVAPPYNLTMDEFEDIAGHKAPHPIRSSTMMNWARDAEMAPRMRAAGIGSLAIRLPACFPCQSAASACLSLVRKVSQVGKAANIAVDLDAPTRRLLGIMNADMVTVAQRSAANALMETFKAEFSVDIARGVGVLRYVVTQNGARPMALLRSWALSNIADENPAAVAEGRSQMEAFARYQRERSRRGILTGMGLFGAAVPADTEPLPADENLGMMLQALAGARTVN